MKACFQIAECCFFYAKIHIFLRKTLKNPCYYNNKKKILAAAGILILSGAAVMAFYIWKKKYFTYN